MHVMHQSDAVRDQRQFSLASLFTLTALVLVLQTPGTLDAPSQLVSDLDFPTPARVLELRPEGPPPWVDADQMLSEEAEEVPPLPVAHREDAAQLDPRERPQR
jgi:hypothetical protein